MKPKLTQWFSGNKKPVRVGVYQRQYSHSGVGYCYWDGKYFNEGRCDIATAFAFKNRKSNFQKLPWRGLMENQK